MRSRNSPVKSAHDVFANRRLESKSDLLLLVVCRFLCGLLALLISSVRGYHARLAIGCHNNAACDGGLAILLYGERQDVVVNLLVRPHIGLWITGDGIVLSVKLTGPLICGKLRDKHVGRSGADGVDERCRYDARQATTQ